MPLLNYLDDEESAFAETISSEYWRLIMTDGTFEKVHHSDKRMYGPTRLLLCGFAVSTQSKFITVLEMAKLSHVPVVWVNEALAKRRLSELLDLPDGSGVGEESTLPRAIIVSGITENQLHGLMALCRKTGMKNALWAALTPTSERWAVAKLLSELQAERKALSKSSTKSAP